MIGITELQTAIYEQLERAGLSVYAYSPENGKEKYPYVYLGEEYIETEHTKTNQRFIINHVLHTYAKGKNKAIINGYNEKVYGALMSGFPVANGYYISRVSLDYAQTVLEDKELWHGVLRFTFHISKG